MPSCETVEKAKMPFKSCCFVAFNDAQNRVINPTAVIVQIQPCESANIGVIRATK